jgi:1-acyl-sn-glycerol-3-phosphate acyltransferase
MNGLLIIILNIIGSRSKFIGFDKIPKGKPLIIVSNHQNLLDISPIIWGFRDYHPKFISKKELGSGIPSISYNLKNGGSLLIDRKKGSQAVKQIFEFGESLNEKNYSVVLYPEGTRSKTGVVRNFKVGGLKALVESMPNAVVVPFAIYADYKITRSGTFPLELGHTLTYSVLDPIDPKMYEIEELTSKLNSIIKIELGQ